jgi:peptide/nickel transport system ATP-binding protein
MGLPATTDVQEPPRVIDPGEGCRFRGRCPYAIDECSRVTPRLRVLRPAHDAACHVATSDLERSNRPGYEKDTRAQI